MNRIDPNSALPLYHQLYEVLHDKIVNNAWQPGDLIPAEFELTDKYRVSRITVRRVLDMLAKEGLIKRERGRGTFVAEPRLEHGLSRIVNFTEDMLQRGYQPSTQVLFAGMVPASDFIAEKLNIAEGEQLVRFDRLRMGDDEPMCIEHSYLIHSYVPGILKYDFGKHSLSKVKSSEYGIRWKRATQVIEAILSPPDLAHQLRIKTNSALLFIERVSFSQHNIPVEYLRAYYRADRYRLYNEVVGGAG
jgi:GntR family transcriptional regulator